MEDIKFEALKKVGVIGFKSKALSRISKIDSISPPSVFVGSGLSYPNMNVGILSPIQKVEDAWLYDDCKYWANNNFEVGDVVKMREGMLNSRMTQRATDVRFGNRFLDIAKEIAIAASPVEVEIKLKKNINVNRSSNRVTMPTALGAPLKNAKITSNVKVERVVDKVMNDDLKAASGMEILYKKDISEYALSKILSIGALGIQKNKRMVPTRWSITATDDTLGKSVLKKVRDYKIIEDFGFSFGEFMGNQYLIYFFPGVFSYELFELYLPGSSWNPGEEIKAATDNEWFDGRKEYAKDCAGGYYAARLPIIEYLNSIKRQASVLVIRLETPSYWASLGVWVVRESVRKALNNGVMKFASKEELLDCGNRISKIKYDFDCNEIYKKSKLLNYLVVQRRLGEWF